MLRSSGYMKLARINWMLITVCFLQAQSPLAVKLRPAFEVASVKAAPPGAVRSGRPGGPGTEDPGHLFWQAPLRLLIAYAYQIGSDEIIAPQWVGTAMYSVAADIPPGTTKGEFHLMLQNLLIERFQMAVRRETKIVDGYVLVLAKSGSKLKESAPTAASGTGGENSISASFHEDEVIIKYEKVSIASFAGDLGRRVQQVNRATGASVHLKDETGLKGPYSFMLRYSLAASDSMAPDLFGAVESQLGLRLSPRKVSIEAIIVDHIQKQPLEN